GLTGPAQAADPQPYRLVFAASDQRPLDEAIAGSSQLEALRVKAPVGPFALMARARQDVTRLGAVLESLGYYQSRITMTLAGQDLEDPQLPGWLEALPPGEETEIRVMVTLGPLFHLRQIILAGDVPPVLREGFALKPGDPAVAATILATGEQLLETLREAGHGLAKVELPDASLIPDEQAMDLVFPVTAGPLVEIGRIRFQGLEQVNESYATQRLLVKPGDRYRTSRLDAARQDLAATGVFSSVGMRAATALDLEGRLPLDITVAERARRAVNFDAAFSTDLGASFGTTWSHRNLFGNAEQLNLSLAASGLGGNASHGLGYHTQAQLLTPDFMRRDQTLDLTLGALQQSLDAYDQTAISAGATLTRRLSPQWSGSVGLTAIEEAITQQGERRNYTLLGVPLTGHYDNLHLANPLDDPVRGWRGMTSVTPTLAFSGASPFFTIFQASASGYFDLADLGLGRPGRSVLAVRGLVGSAPGASQFDLPPDQRFYGGGSATVRGFRYQSIGPKFPDDSPQGGAAIDAGTLEFRQRLGDSLGAVLFVDAGQVNAKSLPFQGDLETGVGMGVRYYSAIGPVRVDVALPVKRPEGGDCFELYMGLGQAF
ncbi:MAG: BamA/TamA family outer membrane protein, partial [Pseudomonadota bacterium]